MPISAVEAENIDLWGINLRGTWLFGSGHDYELVSLTAYEWHDLFRRENTDGGARFLLETTYASSAWQLSEQLELRGPIRESKFGDGDWTLGVYYLKDELDVTNLLDRVGAADLDQQYTQELWNFAAYAQMEYRIQPGCEIISCESKESAKSP